MKISELIEHLNSIRDEGQDEIAICVRYKSDGNWKHFKDFGLYDAPNFCVLDVFWPDDNN